MQEHNSNIDPGVERGEMQFLWVIVINFTTRERLKKTGMEEIKKCRNHFYKVRWEEVILHYLHV